MFFLKKLSLLKLLSDKFNTIIDMINIIIFIIIKSITIKNIIICNINIMIFIIINIINIKNTIIFIIINIIHIIINKFVENIINIKK